MARDKQPAFDPYAQFMGDMGQSIGFARDYLPGGDKPLQHMSTAVTPAMQNSLNNYAAYADPAGDAYAGRWSNEAQGNSRLMRSRLDPKSKNYAGKMGASQDQLMRRMRDKAFSKPQRTTDMRDIVSRFRSGLQGYAASENNAARSQAHGGIARGYAAENYQNKSDAARRGIRGASSSAQERNTRAAKRDDINRFETDLFVKNADEKQERLNEYGGFMRGLEDEEYRRGEKAGDDYRNHLTTQSDKQYDRVNSATRDYIDKTDTYDDKFHDRGRQARTDYRDMLAGVEEIQRNLGLFNIGQDEKTDARDTAGVMGILNIINQMRNQNEQNSIAREYGAKL